MKLVVMNVIQFLTKSKISCLNSLGNKTRLHGRLNNRAEQVFNLENLRAENQIQTSSSVHETSGNEQAQPSST